MSGRRSTTSRCSSNATCQGLYPNFNPETSPPRSAISKTRYRTDADGRFRVVGLPGRGVVTARPTTGGSWAGWGAETIAGRPNCRIAGPALRPTTGSSPPSTRRPEGGRHPPDRARPSAEGAGPGARSRRGRCGSGSSTRPASRSNHAVAYGQLRTRRGRPRRPQPLRCQRRARVGGLRMPGKPRTGGADPAPGPEDQGVA